MCFLNVISVSCIMPHQKKGMYAHMVEFGTSTVEPLFADATRELSPSNFVPRMLSVYRSGGR